jgi:hypothetical protein
MTPWGTCLSDVDGTELVSNRKQPAHRARGVRLTTCRLDSRVRGRPESIPNWPTQEIDQQRPPDRQPDERAKVASGQGVEQVANQVASQDRDRKPMAPSATRPQTERSASAGRGHGHHEDHGPRSHPQEGGSSLGIEAPHGLEPRAGECQGDRGGTAYQRPRSEEDAERSQSERTLGAQRPALASQ